MTTPDNTIAIKAADAAAAAAMTAMTAMAAAAANKAAKETKAATLAALARWTSSSSAAAKAAAEEVVAATQALTAAKEALAKAKAASAAAEAVPAVVAWRAEQAAAAQAASAAAQVARAAEAKERRGTALGGAVHLRLPEMAVSFARGVVIQAWLRPDRLQEAPIVELSQGPSLGRVALVARNDAIELQWHAADGKLIKARAPQCLSVGVWVHVSVALGVDGVVFYRNGVVVAAAVPTATPAALEAARACNYIGASAEANGPKFAGAVADLRLWNRSAGHDAIVARSSRALRGDEAGLCGWWTLEGAEGWRDSSPFARHATLVGGAWQAGSTSFDQDPSPDTHALDLGVGAGTIAIGGFELTGAGFTWQAKLWVRDLARTGGLLSLKGPTPLDLKLANGALECAVSGLFLRVPGVVEANTWIGLALRQGVDGALTVFVDGAPVGSPLVAALKPGTYTATVSGIDGAIAELRLWSRGLSSAELVDTAARRIHGWAPGLIGCWRMDDEALSRQPALLATICDDRDFGGASKSLAVGSHDSTALGIGNDRLSSLRVPFGLKVTLHEHGGFAGKHWTYTSDCALVSANDQASSVVVEALPGLVNADPAGPVAVVTGASPAPRGDLAFGFAPTVAPPRAAGFTGSEKLTLPGLPRIGEAGISLQLWLRPEQLADATFLKLVDSSKTGKQTIKLVSDSAGGLGIGYRDSQWPQYLRAEGVFAACTWTQITVTIATDGVVCLYRDGRLVVREEHDAPAVGALDSVVVGDGFVGCITELRVWSRALGAAELEQQWRRRVSGGAGLAGRWALAGDLAGAPGPATGAPIWREAPALALSEGPAVTVATVTARASLIADQTGAGGTPDLVVDLTALDAAGRPQVGVELTVVLDKEASVHRGTSRGPKLELTGNPRRTFKVRTGAGGRVRLAMAATGLLAPIFRVRHAAMGEGEWALITPDQVIHQALATLTEKEVVGGRKPTSTTRAGKRGLVNADGDKLVKLLRGMMGAAAAFSFEEQSTAALAFGDDGDAAPGVPLVAGDGGNFRVDVDAPLVRRLGAALLPGGATMPESFGLVDDVCSFVVNTSKAVVSGVVHTVEAVGQGVVTAAKAVVESIEVRVDMMIAGMKVVVNAVLKTVEDIANAMLTVLKAIGKGVLDVLDFLAELFDWSDILATADLMLGELTRSITAVETGVAGVFTDLKSGIRAIEAQALTALGGQASLPASAGEARQEVAEAGPPEPPGMLDYLLALLPDDLEQTIQEFRKIFDPIRGVLSGALARLAALGDGLASEWNDPALQAARKDPSKLLDSDPADWLAIARLMLRVVTNGTVLVVDFVGDLAVAIVQSFKRLIDLPLNLPVFTEFVEKYVLKGRKLTVGIVLCLIPAIPTTVLYKAITGRKDGPAALASAGPRSFGGDDAPDYLDILLRGMNLVTTAICGGADSMEAAAGKDIEGIGWLKWGFGGASVVVGGAGLFKDGFGDERDSTTKRAKYGLDIASWVVGFVGWIAGGISMWASSEGTKKIAGWVDNGCGVVGDLCGFVSGILDVILNASDDEASKVDVAIASLDLTASVGSLAASLAGLITDEMAKEPIGLAAKVGGTVGGNLVNGGAQLAALSVVIVASVA